MMQCNTKLKKYWLSLEGQELFTYRREEDADPKQSLFLKNLQIRDETCISVDSKPVYSFSIFHTLKKRRYYVNTEEERDSWLAALRKALGRRKIEEEYTLE